MPSNMLRSEAVGQIGNFPTPTLLLLVSAWFLRGLHSDCAHGAHQGKTGHEHTSSFNFFFF